MLAACITEVLGLNPSRDKKLVQRPGLELSAYIIQVKSITLEPLPQFSFLLMCNYTTALAKCREFTDVSCSIVCHCQET